MTVLEPSLTPKTIREVLKKLGQYNQLPETPLSEYVLIRQQLHRPENVKDSTAVARAVFDLVATIVTERFAALRQKHQRPHPQTETTIADYIAALRQDAASNNDILMAASSIYYQFLTPELGLGTEEIDAYFPVTDRTMQRKRDEFLELIRQDIIRQEIIARLQYRQKRCLLALPFNPITPLPSQEQTIRTALEQLLRTKAVLLYGAKGIGKTTIALQVAKRSIEMLPISDVAWVELGSSPLSAATSDDLLRLICNSLHINYGNVSPQRAFQSYLATVRQDEQVLLVLDNIDRWLEAVLGTWALLSQCWLVVTADARHAHWSGSEISCKPIAQREAKQLLQFLQAHFYPIKTAADDLDIISDELYMLQQGNIGHIKQTFRFMDQFTPKRGNRSRHQLAVKNLTASQQQLLLMVCYMALNTPLTHDTISDMVLGLQLAPDNRWQQDFLILLDSGYLQSEQHPSERYYHPNFDLDQIMRDTDTITIKLADIVLQQHHNLMSFSMLSCYPLWPMLAPEKLLKMVRLAHQHIKQRNLWQPWLMQLRAIEDTLRPSPAQLIVLLIEKSAALRWLGQFQHAHQEIDDAITLAQQDEFSALLAEGLLERARLSAYLGVPDTTDAQWAGEIFTEHNDADGVQRTLLTLARLWFRTDPNTAEHLLNQIEHHDLSHWALLAEIKLAQGEIDEALKLTRRCLRQASHEEAAYARLLNLLGQILLTDGQVEQAAAVYENAINYAQQYYDVWSLARLYTNFAAMLMNESDNENDLYSAREQLLRAIQLYTQLQDEEGYQAAQANLSLLETLLREA